MKKTVQLKLKEMVDALELSNEPIFDSVVVNYRSDEDDTIENNELEGDSGCIIAIGNTKFDERAIKKGFNDTTNTGFMAMVWKRTCNNYIEKFEKGPEIVAKMLLDNRELEGTVKDVYPLTIDWNLYRADTIGVFLMSELTFRIKNRFFVG